MQTISLKTAPELKRVVLAAFPGYRKQNVFLSAFYEGGMNVNSYWDGGSRDEYAIVNMISGERQPLPTQSHPYYNVSAKGLANEENEVVSVDHVGNVTLKALPENFALVQAGTFMGKAATAKVFVPKANLTKFLAA
jgi:hypothetical protein